MTITINAPNKSYTYVTFARTAKSVVRASGKLENNNHSIIIFFFNTKGANTSLPQQTDYRNDAPNKLKSHKFVFTYRWLIFL